MYVLFFGIRLSSPKPLNRIDACSTPDIAANTFCACCVVLPAISVMMCFCAAAEMPYIHVPVALKDKNTRGVGVWLTLAWVTCTCTVPKRLYPAPALCRAWVARNEVACVANSWLLYATALHVWDTVTLTCVASAPMG